MSPDAGDRSGGYPGGTLASSWFTYDMVGVGKVMDLFTRRHELWGVAVLCASCSGLSMRESGPEDEVAGSGGGAGRAGGGGTSGAPDAGMGGAGNEPPTNGGEGAGDSGASGAGGEPPIGDPDPPYSGPTVVELRLAEQHSCAMLRDESVYCWGKDVLAHEDEYGWTDSGLIQWPGGPFATEGVEPPDDDFTQIAYGGSGTGTQEGDFACGLRASGTIECWGDSEYGATNAPPGTYRIVAAGASHACAFGDLTGVTCWGRDDGFQASPPAIVSARNQGYARIAAGGSGVLCSATWSETEEEGGASGYNPSPSVATACGLGMDGVIDCFGAGANIGVPRKKFSDVAVSKRAICGVTADGVECWGEDIEGAAVAGDFVQVSTSWDFTCVVDARGRLTCWAPLPDGAPLAVPEGTFRRVAAGGTNEYGSTRHVSALRTDGSIVTWIPDPKTGDIFQSLELAGPFTDLAAGYDETCGVGTDGGYACWSPYHSPEDVSVGAGDAVRAVVGFNQQCVLRTDGSVSCTGSGASWNTEDFIFVVGEYPGPFTDLSMGGDYACGVLANGGGIQCWGSHVR